jgi:hypothetical protein
MTGAPDRPVRLRQLAGMLAASAWFSDAAPASDAQGEQDLVEARFTNDAIAARPSRYRLVFPLSKLVALAAAATTAISLLALTVKADAQTVTRRQAMAAAIHPVAEPVAMRHWLGRVPVTRDFPSDLTTTLNAQSPLYVIEMTTSQGCLPCGDLWGKLQQLRTRHGIEVRTIAGQEAMLRSGRLGLPWVGHPVAWLRPKADPNRMIPIAVGTDHAANLTRNLYLAAKMLTGVRPAVAVRAMSKFTGIVGVAAPASRKR